MEFKMVKCTGFLKPVRDGVHMEVDVNTGESWKCISGQKIEETESTMKTLYELVNKEFTGVLVGTKTVATKEELYVIGGGEETISCLGHIIQHEIPYSIVAELKELKKCGIVYYANNKKHLVPLELAKEVEKEE